MLDNQFFIISRTIDKSINYLDCYFISIAKLIIPQSDNALEWEWKEKFNHDTFSIQYHGNLE